MICEKLWKILGRRKSLGDILLQTKLQRCLTTLDLTLLGVGLMIGAGIYVLTGTVIRTRSGPAAILSYLIAGIAALLSSLCYAEFGARVPRAGSAYSYTYVAVGEFWAFFVGWNVILEYILSVASISVAFSATADSFCNGCIKNWTCEHLTRFHETFLVDCPDLPAMAIIIVLTVFVTVGVKISAVLTNIMVVINIIVLLVIIVAGLTKADPANFLNKDHGGFMPFKFNGVIQGAASCFYAYIGFDGIGIAGEETKNPSRSIPIATGVSLAIAMILYMGTTSTLTLMVPYNQVDIAAPFPAAFQYVGLKWVKLVVAIGSFVGISCALLTHTYALPRIVYAMAEDGLIFRCLAYVNSKTQTPLIAIGISSLIAIILAFFLDMETLVDFLSIGTLLAFTFVAACVILLRYQHKGKEETTPDASSESDSDAICLFKNKETISKKCHLKDYFLQSTHFQGLKNYSTEGMTTLLVTIMTVAMVILASVLLNGVTASNSTARIFSIIFAIISSLIIALCLAGISMHKQNTDCSTFMMPLVPVLPAASMLFNIVLILELNWLTWIRLIVWMSIGFLIYFLYGIRHSSENQPLSSALKLIHYDTDNKDSLSSENEN